MGKKNICRVITLYNNFLPARKDKHKWTYCAFGLVDGIDVSDDIISEKAKVPNCIWEKQNELSNTLSSKYAAQQVFVLKYGCPEEEADFWQLDEEYPFVFFSRIQCGENKESLWENLEHLEKALQIENEIRTSIYLTFDNSDLFIVLRSKLYEQGAGMIDALHYKNNLSLDKSRPCALKNSFTILAINHEWIDNLTNNELLQQKRIEEVFVKIIKKEDFGISAIINALNDKKCYFSNSEKIDIDKTTVLGIDDVLISIKNISWFDFLSLYKSKSGIFCNWHDLYQESIAGATTIIKTKGTNYETCLQKKRFTRVCKDSYSREKELSSIYLEQTAMLAKKLENTEKIVGRFEGFKEIKLIVKVLPKFGGEIFNDYIFFPIIGPLNALLDLVQCRKEYGQDTASFFDFLKGFSMYVQWSARPDKNAIQVIDFNTKIYDIPCKLNAFYCAFIYNVKSVFGVPKDEECEANRYEFLTVPGMTSFVNVVELYAKASEKLRLMRVEIPERSFYDMHDMMIILAHEMAHYVGRKYRNREYRFHKILSSYAQIYVNYVRNFLFTEGVQLSDETAEIIVKRAEKLIRSALKREKDESYIINRKMINVPKEQIESIIKMNETYEYHFSNLIINIESTMVDILQYGLDNIFSPILYELDTEKKNDRLEIIKLASERFMYKQEKGGTLLSSQTSLAALKVLYEESYADLMAILLLNITIKDYVRSIINNVKQQGMSIHELVDSDVAYRVGCVLFCMANCEINGYNCKNIKSAFSDDKEAEYVADKIIRKWVDVMFSNKKPYLCSDYSIRDLNVYAEKKVLKNLYEYLEVCAKTFSKDLEKENRRVEELRNVFNRFSNDVNESIEKQIVTMAVFIENYREEVLKEMDAAKKR